MWSREELKTRAKAVLRGNYWKAFLVSLVIALVGGDGGGGGGGNYRNNHNNYWSLDSTTAHNVFMLTLSIVFLLLVLRIFLGYHLEVGGRRYFIKSSRYEDNRNCFRFAFDGGFYSKILITMLQRGIQNFLWYLLLIIPGIVKSYAYRMVPYILADNPEIGSSRAIELSNKMTDGHKLDMFVLDLSFIGWFLLGTLALFVGVLFVLPYQNATYAELYAVLRGYAISGGLCSAEELEVNYGRNDG